MSNREWTKLVADGRKRADEAEKRATESINLMMSGEGVRDDIKKLATMLACRVAKLEGQIEELLARAATDWLQLPEPCTKRTGRAEGAGYESTLGYSFLLSGTDLRSSSGNLVYGVHVI